MPRPEVRLDGDRSVLAVGMTAAEQLHAAEASLVELQARLTPEHPDVVRLKRALPELRRRAEAEGGRRGGTTPTPLNPAEATQRRLLADSQGELSSLEQQISSKTAEENRLRSQIADYQRRVEAAPAREVELTELTRDYDIIQGSYRDLLQKRQASQLAANLERRQIGEQFKVLDPPRRPERPFSPARRQIYGIGLAAGLGLGLVLAAIAEYLDRGMRSEEDVRIILDMPVLATIPVVRSHKQAAGLVLFDREDWPPRQDPRRDARGTL
jgi:uncharacterized protein involved in exopolysaccharide biosynthesis